MDITKTLKKINDFFIDIHNCQGRTSEKRPGFSVVPLKAFMEAEKYKHLELFLVLCHYNGWLGRHAITCAEDILIELHELEEKIIKKLTTIWSKVNENINSGSDINSFNYPFEEVSVFLKSLNLQEFHSLENSINIIDWISVGTGHPSSFFSESCSDSEFEEISYVMSILGIPFAKGNLLISSDNPKLFSHLAHNYNSDNKITFYDATTIGKTTWMLVEMLEDFKAFQFVERQTEAFFPFDDAKFDGIFYDGIEKSDSSMKKGSALDMIDLVSPNGWLYHYSKERLFQEKLFKNFQVRLVIDRPSRMGFDTGILVFNSKPINESHIHLSEWFDDSWVGVHEDVFERTLLTIDDFLSAKSVEARKVKRKKGQESFVWKPKTEILFPLSDFGKALSPAKSNIHIVDPNDLTDNPFVARLNSDYYLRNNDELINNEKLVAAFKIRQTDNDRWTYDCPDEFNATFWKLLNSPKPPKETKYLELKLTTRCLTKHVVLGIPSYYSSKKKYAIVNASESKPVLYKPLAFEIFIEDYGPAEDEYLELANTLAVFTITDSCDENFIVYQLMHEDNSYEKLLVAPTKEEQHEFYLNKRDEYMRSYNDIQLIINQEYEEMEQGLSDGIKSIGFQNFRRFESMDPISLYGINIFVGGNNSGKSTIVKGLLLALDNIKLLEENQNNTALSPMFHFDAKRYHDVNINITSRACNEKYRNNQITFNINLSKFDIKLVVNTRGRLNDATAPISRIIIVDTKLNASFDLDVSKDCLTFKIPNNSGDYLMAKINNVSRIRHQNGFLSGLIHSVILFSYNNPSNEELAKKRGILREMMNEFIVVVKNSTIEYVQAHSISQNILYSLNDKNDYLAETLHHFVHDGAYHSSQVCDRVRHWMRTLQVGDDFIIDSIGGEAYSVRIVNEKGIKSYLSNLGMGTIQLMTLLFKLATISNQYTGTIKPIVIIEEPEMNMHPALQSKLADLFSSMNNEYGMRFIVETHSEYLVRKTQVLVAQQNQSLNCPRTENQFVVYYFPTSGQPYDMVYLPDGRFNEEFGKGFFDEAANLAFEIF